MREWLGAQTTFLANIWMSLWIYKGVGPAPCCQGPNSHRGLSASQPTSYAQPPGNERIVANWLTAKQSYAGATEPKCLIAKQLRAWNRALSQTDH